VTSSRRRRGSAVSCAARAARSGRRRRRCRVVRADPSRRARARRRLGSRTRWRPAPTRRTCLPAAASSRSPRGCSASRPTPTTSPRLLGPRSRPRRPPRDASRSAEAPATHRRRSCASGSATRSRHARRPGLAGVHATRADDAELASVAPSLARGDARTAASCRPSARCAAARSGRLAGRDVRPADGPPRRAARGALDARSAGSGSATGHGIALADARRDRPWDVHRRHRRGSRRRALPRRPGARARPDCCAATGRRAVPRGRHRARARGAPDHRRRHARDAARRGRGARAPARRSARACSSPTARCGRRR
jgi:hypothetical protein